MEKAIFLKRIALLTKPFFRVLIKLCGDRTLSFSVFSLYVGVATFNSPQDCLPSKLCFVAATFPAPVFGVGLVFLHTLCMLLC